MRYVLVLLLLLAIVGVHAEVTGITDTSATVLATSDMPVTFTLYAGSSPEDLNIVIGGGTGTSTSMTLNELTPATTYYYAVERCADSCINDTLANFTTLETNVSEPPMNGSAPAVWLQAFAQDGIVTLTATSDTDVQFTFGIGTDLTNLTAIPGDYGTSSSTTLDALQEGVKYYATVRGCDAQCAEVNISFTLPPPQVSASVSGITNTGAAVSAQGTQPGTFLLIYSTNADMLLDGGVADTMREGETKTYTFNDVDYEMTFVAAAADAVAFSVNGEVFESLHEGSAVELPGGIALYISTILVNDRESVVSFFIGSAPEEIKMDVDGSGKGAKASMDGLSPATTYYYAVIICTDDWCTASDLGDFTTTNVTPKPRRSGGGGGGGGGYYPRMNATNATNATAQGNPSNATDAIGAVADVPRGAELVASSQPPRETLADELPVPETALAAPAAPEIAAGGDVLTGLVVEEPRQESWLSSFWQTIIGWLR